MVNVTNDIADMKLRVKYGESVKNIYKNAHNKFIRKIFFPSISIHFIPTILKNLGETSNLLMQIRTTKIN
jgi:hypothetical protein